MQKKYILTIDQSTSASKVMLIDGQASLVAKSSKTHEQYYPKDGFVEHDAEEIFQNLLAGIAESMNDSNCIEDEIAGIAITNQRETALVWDKVTGKPIANAAVWQCQRGVDICNSLRENGKEEMIREKTGLLIDPYFSASKLRWLVENIDGAKQKMEEGRLLLGTMDSWIVWRLTGGKVHSTDYSNACRTMLFNIKTLSWDEDLIELFSLNSNMFPEAKCSDEIFGHTDPSVVFSKPIPISGILGDSHAALFGQNCFQSGMAKATYGTGSSIMMNVGTKCVDAPNGLVTSIGWGQKNVVDYVFEGNIHCTGDTLNWMVNDLELIKNAKESEELANLVDDNGGVFMVPAFVGLGAPYWDNEARAAIIGMSRSTKKAHVVRAALESIAYQIKDLIDLMVKGSGVKLDELRVDGGPTRNDFLMQFQADMLGAKIVRTDLEEISALGVAFMAGLAVGFWKNKEEIESMRKVDRVFQNNLDNKKVAQLYNGWQLAVKRTQLK